MLYLLVLHRDLTENRLSVPFGFSFELQETSKQSQKCVFQGRHHHSFRLYFVVHFTVLHFCVRDILLQAAFKKHPSIHALPVVWTTVTLLLISFHLLADLQYFFEVRKISGKSGC